MAAGPITGRPRDLPVRRGRSSRAHSRTVSAWTSKPCARCGGNKGPKFIDKKYCFRCTSAVKKDASTKAHRSRVAKVYGIQPDDYDRLYAAQGGRCAICQRATGATRRLSVDHDHATTKVRGLLCRPCNDMLGHARDDPQFFMRATNYLFTPPADSILE